MPDYRAAGFKSPGAVVRPEFQVPKQAQGSLTTYHPSLGEKLTGYLSSGLQALGVGDQEASRLGSKWFRALDDLTPVGNATMAADAGTDIKNGHWLRGLGLGALAVLPGVPAKGARGMFGRGIKAFHGGRAFEGEFDLARAGSGLGYADEPAAWFTPDPYEANRYAWSVGNSGTYNGKAVYPATIDNSGFHEIPPMSYDPEEFARILAEARKAGHPGVVFRSVKEDDRLSTPADQIAVLDPTRIKSAFNR